MSVRKWPMLPNLVLTEALRDSIEQEREETGLSMSELMRQALCAHYNLRCETVHSFGGQQPEAGKVFSLRVSPELFRALKRDKEASGIPMARLVRNVLNEHYSTNGGPP